jgi:hypothetical protein
MWIYNGREITDEDLVGFEAFVYCITNLIDGRQYIGKKRLKFLRRKSVAGKKRKIKTSTDSDWKIYYGSSAELIADVARLGSENFRREIIRLCKTKSESNYYELKEQVMRDVLLHPDQYYNSFVGTKIHRKHMLRSSK